MQDSQPRWMRTLSWLILGLGVVLLLVAVIFLRSFYSSAISLFLILSRTSILVRPTRPGLATVCMVLSFAAAIAAFVAVFSSGIRIDSCQSSQP